MSNTRGFLEIMVEKYNRASYQQAYFIFKENYSEALYWNGVVKAINELIVQYEIVEFFSIETTLETYKGIHYTTITLK